MTPHKKKAITGSQKEPSAVLKGSERILTAEGWRRLTIKKKQGKDEGKKTKS